MVETTWIQVIIEKCLFAGATHRVGDVGWEDLQCLSISNILSYYLVHLTRVVLFIYDFLSFN